MTSFPRRSPDLLFADLADIRVVFDLAREHVHLVNRTAGTLLDACDGVGDLDAAIDRWSAVTGEDRSVIAGDVAAGLADLTDLELIGRTSGLAPFASRGGSTAAPMPCAGGVHVVLGEGLQFRGSQQDLVDLADAQFDLVDDEQVASLHLDLTEDPDGVVRLQADTEWAFPSRRSLLDQLPSVINEYVLGSASCLALHAAGARSPSGKLVVLPATSGSGKSTLVGALITAGWDYLGDEAVSIRPDTLHAMAYAKPLALDAGSREALGLGPSSSPSTAPAELRHDVVKVIGDAGPIDRIILPTYRPGAVPSIVALEPHEAVVALLEHTLNLRRVGQVGLESLCSLASTVPIHRLVHGGAAEAVRAIDDLLA